MAGAGWGLGRPGIGGQEMKDRDRTAVVTQEQVDRILSESGQTRDFDVLMMHYECAMSEVRTKLEVLNREMGLRNNRNPFDSIESRLKAPASIYEKMERKGIPFTVENIEKNLNDVAGCRVICSFIDDIYLIRGLLAAQDDVRVIQVKDYIKHPKKNGYRSLHMIIEIPIFLTKAKKFVRVELQFRTIAMDFWASVEHQLKYKKQIGGESTEVERIVDEMRKSAEMINQLDLEMLQIRDEIARLEGETVSSPLSGLRD